MTHAMYLQFWNKIKPASAKDSGWRRRLSLLLMRAGDISLSLRLQACEAARPSATIYFLVFAA